MEEKAKNVADLLKVLANEQRLLILCALSKSDMTVNEIHGYTPNISQSALSQHLHSLKLCGVLDSEKHGLNVEYTIKDKKILNLLEVLKSEYCEK